MYEKPTRAMIFSKDDVDPNGFGFSPGSIHRKATPIFVHSFVPKTIIKLWIALLKANYFEEKLNHFLEIENTIFPRYRNHEEHKLENGERRLRMNNWINPEPTCNLAISMSGGKGGGGLTTLRVWILIIVSDCRGIFLLWS